MVIYSFVPPFGQVAAEQDEVKWGAEWRALLAIQPNPINQAIVLLLWAHVCSEVGF